MIENKRKKEQEIMMINQQKNVTLNTSADLGDSKGFQRAKTAGYRTRGNSSHYSSVIDKDEDDDEEELTRKLQEYEAMLHRAENLRLMRLEENMERVHRNNELIYEKQAIKHELTKESELTRLREMVEQFMARQKKTKKQQ